MPKTIRVEPADEALRTIVSEAGQSPCFLVVDGRREAVVLGAEAYDSLLETLQIESDADLVASIRRGMQDAAAGRTRPAGTEVGGDDPWLKACGAIPDEDAAEMLRATEEGCEQAEVR